MPSWSKGILVIIGGAADMSGECKILQRFIDLAQGNDARIVVMTVASGEPEKIGKDYQEAFRRLGVKNIEIIDTGARTDASDERALEKIKHATGVFFTGGQQERIYKLLKHTPIDHLLHQRFREEDFVIAGTSAGAHAMSTIMIADGTSAINPRYQSNTLQPGLGFIRRVLIDSHFEQRGRLGRLLSGLSQQTHMWGLGLDENTCVVVQGNKFEVIGDNAITIVDGTDINCGSFHKLRKGDALALSGIKLIILPENYKFDLGSLKPIID